MQLAFALDMSSTSTVIVGVIRNLVALRQPGSHVCKQGFSVPVAGPTPNDAMKLRVTLPVAVRCTVYLDVLVSG